MTLTFDRLTFQLSRSEEHLGNLSDDALSTLLSNLVGSYEGCSESSDPGVISLYQQCSMPENCTK